MASRLPEARSKEYRICTHPDPLINPVLNQFSLTPLNSLLPKKLGHTVLRIQACCFSFAWKAIKLFFLWILHPKLCLWDSIQHWCTGAKFFSIIINSQSDTLTQIFIDLATVGLNGGWGSPLRPHNPKQPVFSWTYINEEVPFPNSYAVRRQINWLSPLIPQTHLQVWEAALHM